MSIKTDIFVILDKSFYNLESSPKVAVMIYHVNTQPQAKMRMTMMLNAFWMSSICFCHNVGRKFTWLWQIIQNRTYGCKPFPERKILVWTFLWKKNIGVNFSVKEIYWCEPVHQLVTFLQLPAAKLLIDTKLLSCNCNSNYTSQTKMPF